MSLLEVLVVRHGTRETLRSEVYRDYALYGEPDGVQRVDYYFWVVLGGPRPLLVDTGFAPEPAGRRGREVLIDPVEACRELGMDPDGELDIVITHAHYDHIGNLGRFPRATIYIAASELDFWRQGWATSAVIGHYVEAEELADLERADEAGRLRTFAGRAQITPGVQVQEVGGHTPGQSIVLIETSTGVILLAADAAHFQEELDRDMPFASATNLPDLLRGLKLIRDLRDDGLVSVVVPGHEPGIVQHFAPAGNARSGALSGNVATITGSVSAPSR